jgi:hypothetical protein
MPAGLVFQIITILEDREWTPLRWAQPPGLSVSLSAPSPVVLPKHPISLRVNQEIEVAAIRIRQMMQARGGVLVTISLQERPPVAAGESASYKFNWVNVDRPGPVPSLVLRTHLTSRPRRGWASKGYVHRRVYLWATPA